MKKFVTLVLSLVLALSIGDVAQAKKVKTQRLSAVTYSRSYLSGKGTKGAKITAKHGKKKLGTAHVNKKGKFKFKLRAPKNKWKVTVTETKKGYKVKKKTITLRIATKKTKKAIAKKKAVKKTATKKKVVKKIAAKKTVVKKTPAKKVVTPKPVIKPSEYLNGHTLVTKEGTLAFDTQAIREIGDSEKTVIIVPFHYTNTTSKLQSPSEIVSFDISASQTFYLTTKSLDTGYPSETSKYDSMNRMMYDQEEVNPGRTVYISASWELEDPYLPVKFTFETPTSYSSIGSLTYY